MIPFVRCIAAAALVILACTRTVPAPAKPPAGLSADEAKQIDRHLKELGERLRELRRTNSPTPQREDLLADAEVFRKGVLWALRYETRLEPADVALIKKALGRGIERADALAAGKPAWPGR